MGFAVILVAFFLGASLVNAYRTWRLLQTAPAPLDLSEDPPPFPDQLTEWREALEAAGFAHEGTVHLPATEGGVVLRLFFREVTVVALTGEMPLNARLTLTTIFADGAVLETHYPRGRRRDQPKRYVQRVVSSLEDAIMTHERRLDELEEASQHGEPLLVADMDTWLDHQRRYMVAHTRAENQARLRLDLLQSAWLLYVIGWLLIVGLTADMDGALRIVLLVITGIPALAGVVGLPWLRSRQ